MAVMVTSMKTKSYEELSDTDANSKKVKDYIIRLSGVKAALEESNTKETFEK